MDRETADRMSSLVPLAVEWATVAAEAGLARGIALDVRYGYEDSPFEIDARQHELSA